VVLACVVVACVNESGDKRWFCTCVLAAAVHWRPRTRCCCPGTAEPTILHAPPARLMWDPYQLHDLLVMRASCLELKSDETSAADQQNDNVWYLVSRTWSCLLEVLIDGIASVYRYVNVNDSSQLGAGVVPACLPAADSLHLLHYGTVW